MSAEHLDMTLLGKEYRISCTAETRDELLATVAFLDDKLREIGARTGSSGEKLAGMKRRIGLMKARLDGVLGQQEKLF